MTAALLKLLTDCLLLVQRTVRFLANGSWLTLFLCTRRVPGSRDRSESYRPISLTCIMGKVYEKLVRKHMVDHVGNLIAPEQHGFLPGRSCTSTLLDSMDVILDMSDDGLPVDMLFFDFSKAFDTVPHHRLLVKLKNYGITGGTLEIIQDFLTDRWPDACRGW